MFTHLAGYGIKNRLPIFENKILIFQSKANLDEKTLLGKITHHLHPEIWKMLVRGTFGDENSTFHSGP